MAREVKEIAMNQSPGPSVATEAECAALAGELFPIELTVLDHYARQRHCVLEILPAILGRNEQAEIKLTDPWVSHEHCKLLRQDGMLVVRDLDSKNGIFLHGVRVLEAEVHSGDCLTLGRTEITIRYREPAVGSREQGAGKLAPCSPLPAPCSLPSRPPQSRGPHTEELLY